MSPSFQDLPDLSRDALVELAGWEVLKEARALQGAGMVRSVTWEAPYLTAEVGQGASKFHPRLNLRSKTFAENRCNCQRGRQGFICSHAIAACIEAEQRRHKSEVEAARAVNMPAPVPEDTPPRLRTIQVDGAGPALYCAFLLPPNLAAAAPRNAITAKLELRTGGQRLLPEGFFRGRAYRVEAPYERALALVERWNDGKLSGLLQLKRPQLRELVEALRGEPAFAWVNKPLEPLKWSGDVLPGVSEHILEPLRSTAPQKGVVETAPAVPQPSVRRGFGVVPPPENRAQPSRDMARMQVDGSPHYLSIAPPSRESPVYDRALSLMKEAGFKLEPSNGRWWLRDRHKVLNFLAEHGETLDKVFDPVYTPNHRQRMQAVHRASVEARGEPQADGSFLLTVKIDAGSVPEPEIHRALAARQFYVVAGDSIWLLPPGRLQKLAEATGALSAQRGQPLLPTMTRRLAPAQLRDAEELLEPVADSLVTPDEWKERSQALKHVGQLKPAPLRPELDRMLRGYQRVGAAWLWHLCRNKLGGILADEMGLGKTLQALCLVSAAVEQGPCAPALVVCPAGLVENWAREAARFAPWLKVFRHHGNNRLGSTAEVESHDLLITSYGTLVRDQELLDGIDYSVVVADEAQHIKNRRTQAAAALRALRTGARFVLTGTPVENSLDDLRSLFAFILPGYLARIPDGVRGEDRAWFDQRHLAQATPYILRRSKTLVAPELPGKITQTVFCELAGPQRRLYDELREKGERALFDMEMGGATEGRLRMEALTQLLRLRQTCADPRIVNEEMSGEDSAKLRALEEILEEAVDGGHRVLVFSQFVSALRLIEARLKELDLSYCYLDGQTPARQREVDRFNGDDSIPVFLISLKAGGTGLNLTGADTVVHFDPWWNPAVEAQATDRAHRIGQTRVVTSIKLIAAGTVEEKVLELQQSKAELLRDLLDESAAATAKISLADLRDLLG